MRVRKEEGLELGWMEMIGATYRFEKKMEHVYEGDEKGQCDEGWRWHTVALTVTGRLS